ncbi:MAG: UDP-3-O-[3-hydroxymyristoyl] N-acetylglucosamine deacetylase [Candidatus Omnitrophica bacterium]|nr:UDP-3-O-[3-hydroxymyristoyl] N-acetylglucosamine deacetylase [Candidatus Omnitrophota bacterium]
MTRQKTIQDPVVIEGTGLQTGAKVTLKLKGAPADSGINFIRADLPNKPLLHIQSLDLGAADSPERRTTLGMGPLQVQTTEHLMAALAGLGIDNIVAEADNVELPGLDGSAKDYVEALKRAHIIEQDTAKKVFIPKEPAWCASGDSLVAVFPDDRLTVSYLMSYDSPSVGTQYMSMPLDEASFEREIAPARTFCLEEEALELLKMGLGKGANYDNTLVMGKAGPIKNTLRFSDEPVRHKILDLIGDLYLLGMPIIGRVIAIKSGHKLNMELVKKLKASAK